jgi:parvulin-like peptidyl-prolyl isomerase
LQLKAFTLAAMAVALGLLGLTGCNESPSANSGDPEVAATVNGVAIPVSEIDRLIEQQITDPKTGQKTPLQPVELAAARMQALQQLIQEEALYQRAQKESVVPTDDELKQELQSQKQQLGMTEEQFQKYLQQSGMTEEKFNLQAKRQLAIKKLQDKIASKVQTPSEDELKRVFEENKASLVAPRGIDLSDIIVDPRPNGTPGDATSPEAAQKKASDIHAVLKSGADFATVARAQSEDPNSAMQGGAIKFFSEAELQQTFPADVATRFFAMSAGQITDPIKANDGRFHIFKVNQKVEQTTPFTYDQVKQRLAQQMVDQRKQVVVSALMIDALASATVKNNLAQRVLEHPDTFGALRPSQLTQPKPAAPAQPAPAQPAAPANANAAQPATK